MAPPAAVCLWGIALPLGEGLTGRGMDHPPRFLRLWLNGIRRPPPPARRSSGQTLLIFYTERSWYAHRRPGRIPGDPAHRPPARHPPDGGGDGEARRGQRTVAGEAVCIPAPHSNRVMRNRNSCIPPAHHRRRRRHPPDGRACISGCLPAGSPQVRQTLAPKALAEKGSKRERERRRRTPTPVKHPPRR